MGYMLTCDDGEFYFDDIDQAIEYGEQNCPRGYNIDEVYDQRGDILARRKRYIKGKVYITNDKVLVGGKGKKRRVVSMGNDKNNMAVKRITSLYDKNGNKKERLIPIEKYSDIPKASGVEDKTFRKTTSGKPIQEKYLSKTNTRLNKWDMERIRRGKNKPKK